MLSIEKIASASEMVQKAVLESLAQRASLQLPLLVRAEKWTLCLRKKCDLFKQI